MNTSKALLLSAVLAMTSATYADDPAAMIKEAKELQAKAKAAEFEWRDMGKIIKGAEAAAKEGKKDEAAKLAKLAVLQGKMALEQAQRAKNAGPAF